MTREQIPPATEAEGMDRVEEVIEMHMKVLSAAYEKAIAYYSSRTLLGYGEILNKPENQESLIKLKTAIEKYNLDEQKRLVRIGRSWHVGQSKR
jgi:hypothetical protein